MPGLWPLPQHAGCRHGAGQSSLYCLLSTFVIASIIDQRRFIDDSSDCNAKAPVTEFLLTFVAIDSLGSFPISFSGNCANNREAPVADQTHENCELCITLASGSALTVLLAFCGRALDSPGSVTAARIPGHRRGTSGAGAGATGEPFDRLGVSVTSSGSSACSAWNWFLVTTCLALVLTTFAGQMLKKLFGVFHQFSSVRKLFSCGLFAGCQRIHCGFWMIEGS